MQRLVGVPTEPGDTRATAHVPMQELNHGQNPGDDSVDAQRMYSDDGDADSSLPAVPTDDDGNPQYDELKNADLKQHLEARGLPVSGKHDELVTRLEEDDASDDEEDDEDDD